MERTLQEEHSMKLQVEGKLLQLEKDHSMLDCDYKQAQQKLDELQTQKKKLSEEVCLCSSLPTLLCSSTVNYCKVSISEHQMTVACILFHHLWLNCSPDAHLAAHKATTEHFVCVQVKNLGLRLEQETQKRSLSQNELKLQSQQVSVLRSSEKQLKQEVNHLLDMKQMLEKQNQELHRSNTHPNILSVMDPAHTVEQL